MSEALTRFLEKRTPANFEQFLRSSREVIFNQAWRYGRGQDFAEEVAQDTYRVIISANVAPDELRDPRAYLITVVRNCARARLRSEVRRRAREAQSARPLDSADCHVSPEDALDLSEAIDKLPEDERAVVILRFHQGLGVNEIATILTVTTRTVFNREQRALSFLRRKLSTSAALLIVPILSDPSGAALPTRAVPARLAEKLERLAATLANPVRPRGLRPPALIAACMTLTVLLGTTAVAVFKGQRSLGTDVDVVVADLPVPGRVPVDTATPVATQAAPGIAKAVTPERKRRPGKNAPVLARNDTPAPARLALTVVDEAGEPVADGSVDLESAPANDVQRGLHRAASAVGLVPSIPTRSLGAAQPITLDVPPALHGFPLTVKVTAPGFVGHRPAKVTLRPGREEKLTVTLLEAVSMTLRVLDAQTGNPVEGAAVELERDPELEPGETDLLTQALGALRESAGKTSAAGTLVLPDVRRGRLWLGVTAPGYAPAESLAESTAEAVTVWLHELRPVEATGSLVVTIIDPDGRAWPRCEFQLHTDPRGSTPRLTDDFGQHRIEALDAGRHAVELVAPKLELTEEAIARIEKLRLYSFVMAEVKAGEETQIILRPADRSSRLRVQVVSEAGKPCPGVVLTAAGRIEKATTDVRGEAVFTDLEVGPVTVQASLGKATVELGRVGLLARSETRAKLTLGRGRIAGRILDEESRPVRARVLCVSPTYLVTSAGDDGRFEIDGLSPGAYELRIDPRDALLVPRVERVAVAGDGKQASLECRLRRGGWLTVLVHTSAGEPARGVKVARRLPDQRLEPLRPAYHGRREAELSSSAALDPGEHVLVITGSPQSQELRVEVQAGGNTIVRLAVRAPEPTGEARPIESPSSSGDGS